MGPDASGVLCDATNTGIAGKGLTAGDMTAQGANGGGGYTTTGNGQTITRKAFTVDVCIVHDNVTITESTFTGELYIGRRMCGTGSGDVVADNFIIQDSTFTGGGSQSPLEGIDDINSAGGIVRRNNISHYQNFISFYGETTTNFYSNYGHDETSAGNCGAEGAIHFDGIEAYSWSAGGITIRNNTIRQHICSSNATAPLNITPLGGTPTNLVVEYNFFQSMQSAYVVLIDNSQGPDLQTATFNQNRFWNSGGSGMFSVNGSANAAQWNGSGNCSVSSLTWTCGASVPVP